MKSRHKKSGGAVYSGGGSKVIKEAAEKRQPFKKGGAVKEMDNMEKEAKEMGRVMGEKGKTRLDKRPRRASGGRVGSDRSPMAPGSATHPFSSAAK